MSYIKLDRKLLEWEWFSDPTTTHLWIYLLLKANIKDKSWQNTVIRRGQLLTSEAKLSVDTGMSRQQIRTALNKLISTNEITKLSTKNYTIITVNKWEIYQGCNQEDNQEITNESTNGATNGATSRATTTKEYKNTRIQEVYIGDTKKGFQKPTLEEVKAYCLERNNNVNPEKWFNYYSANGWKVGKNPMKDWKAAVRTWEKNDTPTETPKRQSYEEQANAWRNF